MGISDKIKNPLNNVGKKSSDTEKEKKTDPDSKNPFSKNDGKNVNKKEKPQKKGFVNPLNNVTGSFGKKKSNGKKKTGMVRKSHMLFLSIAAILAFALALATILHFFSPNGVGSIYRYLESIMSSVLALLFAVIILDNINAHSDKRRKRREERSAILRHNRIIQPVVDMYIVRKNMVITPNDRTVRKFQVDARFTIKDMRDMFGPSELISDVGKSKIETYAVYQSLLQEKFVHLVENIDFSFFPELCDAAMKYINSTSYGASALDAVMGYQTSVAGTKSMKSIVMNMIKSEPDDGKFIDAPPALKNVYLLHQTINDQETALVNYLKIVQSLISEDSKEKGVDHIEYE